MIDRGSMDLRIVSKTIFQHCLRNALWEQRFFMALREHWATPRRVNGTQLCDTGYEYDIHNCSGSGDLRVFSSHWIVETGGKLGIRIVVDETEIVSVAAYDVNDKGIQDAAARLNFNTQNSVYKLCMWACNKAHVLCVCTLSNERLPRAWRSIVFTVSIVFDRVTFTGRSIATRIFLASCPSPFDSIIVFFLRGLIPCCMRSPRMMGKRVTEF